MRSRNGGWKSEGYPLAEGRNVIPSVVDPVTHVVGDVAKRQIVLKPKETIFSIKRLMGRKI